MSFKVSVIMAAYLGEYDDAATDRVRKFHRAVESFLWQTYDNKELIIVSDGCDITSKECKKRYSDNPNITLIDIDKQPMFSGNVRNIGIFYSTGEIIQYLDTDDLLGENHLQNTINHFKEHPTLNWLYYDDVIVYSRNPATDEILASTKRPCSPVSGTIGASNIAHKKTPEFNWQGCDGYGHDWTFIKKLIDSGTPNIKIEGAEYFVCHIPKSVDC